MGIKVVHGWGGEGGNIAPHYLNALEARLNADGSAAPAAEEEIEFLLRRRIAAAYPDHAIIGEEQGGATPGAEYLWAIDPIDGTSAFVQGLPIWGISIGLLRHEQPILGCFYLPLLQEWYEAGLEGPATFNGTPIHVAHDNLLDSEAWLSVPSDSHRLYSIDYPGKTRSLGSMAASLCYVARGTAAGALPGRAHILDIAAGPA